MLSHEFYCLMGSTFEFSSDILNGATRLQNRKFAPVSKIIWSIIHVIHYNFLRGSDDNKSSLKEYVNKVMAP